MKGFRVTIIFDTTELGVWEVVESTFKSRILKWKQDYVNSKLKSMQKTMNVDVLPLQSFANLSPTLFKYDENVAKNMRWALAIERLYHMNKLKFDMVEFFDFTGAASLLLLRRMHKIENHLPHNIIVSVRVHGTFEIIDSIEYMPLMLKQYRRNTMERFALIAADIVFYPSIEVIDAYRKAIGLHIRNGITAVPPIKRMLVLPNDHLNDLDMKKNHNNIRLRVNKKKDINIHNEMKPWKMKNLLVLGKIQRIKGVFYNCSCCIDVDEETTGFGF